jgi:hypothetical protein
MERFSWRPTSNINNNTSSASTLPAADRSGGAFNAQSHPSADSSVQSILNKRRLETESNSNVRKRQRVDRLNEREIVEKSELPQWPDIGIECGASAGSNRKAMGDLLEKSVLPENIKKLISDADQIDLNHRKDRVATNRKDPKVCWLSANAPSTSDLEERSKVPVQIRFGECVARVWKMGRVSFAFILPLAEIFELSFDECSGDGIAKEIVMAFAIHARDTR